MRQDFCLRTKMINGFNTAGVIYCKPHHKELFQPKPVSMDLTQDIINKNLDFSTQDPLG